MVELKNEKCDQCGTCISVCPANAIFLGECIEIDAAVCISCGKCVTVCPYHALDLDLESHAEH